MKGVAITTQQRVAKFAHTSAAAEEAHAGARMVMIVTGSSARSMHRDARELDATEKKGLADRAFAESGRRPSTRPRTPRRAKSCRGYHQARTGSSQ